MFDYNYWTTKSLFMKQKARQDTTLQLHIIQFEKNFTSWQHCHGVIKKLLIIILNVIFSLC